MAVFAEQNISRRLNEFKVLPRISIPFLRRTELRRGEVQIEEGILVVGLLVGDERRIVHVIRLGAHVRPGGGSSPEFKTAKRFH